MSLGWKYQIFWKGNPLDEILAFLNLPATGNFGDTCLPSGYVGQETGLSIRELKTAEKIQLSKWTRKQGPNRNIFSFEDFFGVD